jgi:pimeloyl-ACP methyl ester carboxylesterase
VTQTVQSKDGTVVALERFGAGRPLVLIGGALSTRESGEPYASALADRFDVITFDRRGRGDSGDTPPYAVEREVEDVEALVAEAGGSALVYGHSSGAVLALHAAASGVAIDRLALYEPPFIVDDSRPPVPADYVAHLEDLLAQGLRGDAVEYFMTAVVGLPTETVAGLRNDASWPWMEAVAHTIPYDGRVMGDMMSGDTKPLERWRAVTVPTLVVDGGASPTWQHNAARALADVLPAAHHRTLEGQDHAAAPEAVASALVEFFSR